jgi:hypothetical protein
LSAIVHFDEDVYYYKKVIVVDFSKKKSNIVVFNTHRSCQTQSAISLSANLSRSKSKFQATKLGPRQFIKLENCCMLLKAITFP